jgi:hypothetical protein
MVTGKPGWDIRCVVPRCGAFTASLLLFPAEVIRSPGRGRKDWQYYQGPGKKLIMLQSAPSAGRVGLAPGRGPLSARRLPKVFALSCSFASIAVICHD